MKGLQSGGRRVRSQCGQQCAADSQALPFVCDQQSKFCSDPAFIPGFVETFDRAGTGCGLVQGQRVGRKATGFKKLQSWVANSVRKAVLKDGTRDTGCGFKCFPREVYLS